jgi:hypothetical protein
MSVIGHLEARSGDDVGSCKEGNTYEFGHFGSLKTCGYDRCNGEKELGLLLRLESGGEMCATILVILSAKNSRKGLKNHLMNELISTRLKTRLGGKHSYSPASSSRDGFTQVNNN